MPKHDINMSLYDTITMLAYYFFCLVSEVIQYPFSAFAQLTPAKIPDVFHPQKKAEELK
jgi:hypothetical protein